jgi:hypothetical protein
MFFAVTAGCTARLFSGPAETPCSERSQAEVLCLCPTETAFACRPVEINFVQSIKHRLDDLTALLKIGRENEHVVQVCDTHVPR